MSLLAQLRGLEQATEKGQMSTYSLVILAPHSFFSHIVKIEFNSQINSPVWTRLVFQPCCQHRAGNGLMWTTFYMYETVFAKKPFSFDVNVLLDGTSYIQ